MAYFKPYIDAEGIHIPSYDDVLEYLTSQYRGIFGEDVYLGAESPDYQMISVFAKCLTDFSALAVDTYNARSPYYASGNSLDVLVQLAGIIRRPATQSSAVLKLSGTEGTVVPEGSKVIDKSGYLWTILGAKTIPASGYIDADALCDTPGAVVASAGTIIGIYTPIIGWESVTNEASATVGKDTESDSMLRQRFLVSHTTERNGMADTIVSSLINLPGVEYVALIVNDEDTTVSGVPAHSIYAIVSGGDEDEIASTIYSRKAPGIGTHGTISKTVTDETGTSRTVKFSRPTITEVTVTVSIVELPGYSAEDDEQVIKQSVIKDINSLGIGKSWNVTMGYKDIYSNYSDNLPFSITSISASSTHGTSTSVVPCAADEVLTTSEAKVIIAT